MTTALSHDDLRPRDYSPLGLGAALALLAHVGLIAALALGLNWRLPKSPAVVSAELWAAVPQVAAAAAPPAPTPAPVPAPAPVPVPTPVPPPARPVPAPVPPAPAPQPKGPSPAERAAAQAAERAAEREAEIALEKAAQHRKAQQDQALREAREAQTARDAKQARETAERARLQAAEAQRLTQKLEDKRLVDEKILAQKHEKQLKNDKAREAKRLADLAEQKEQQAREAEAKAQDALVAKQREENLKRMLGQAGAAANAGATGSAARDAAPSATYAGRIRAHVKPNILAATEVLGNPITEVEVKCAPDGSVISRRISKPSGNPSWDNIVLRAIDKTAKLPLDDGRIPATMTLVFPRQD